MIGLHVDLMIHRHQEALARTRAQHGNASHESRSSASRQPALTHPHSLNSHKHRASIDRQQHSHETSLPHPEAGMFAASSLKPDSTDPLQTGTTSSSFHQQFEPLSSSYSTFAPASTPQSVDNFASYGTTSGDTSSHSLGMHQSQYLGSSSMMDDVDDVPDLFSATDLQSASAAYSFLSSLPHATLDDDVVLHRGVSHLVAAAAAPSSLSTFSSPSSLSCGGDETSSITPVSRMSEEKMNKMSHFTQRSHSSSSPSSLSTSHGQEASIDTSRPTHLNRFMKSQEKDSRFSSSPGSKSRPDFGSAGEFPSDLWDACRRGSAVFVEFFLRDNPNVNDNTTAESLDSDEHSPLFYACAGGHTHIVAVLLAHNPLQLIDPEIECYQHATNSTIRSLLDEHLRWQVARDDEFYVEWSNAHASDNDEDDAISLDSACSDCESLRFGESEKEEEERVYAKDRNTSVHVHANGKGQRDVDEHGRRKGDSSSGGG